jgi:hypothetical protein
LIYNIQKNKNKKKEKKGLGRGEGTLPSASFFSLSNIANKKNSNYKRCRRRGAWQHWQGQIAIIVLFLNLLDL